MQIRQLGLGIALLAFSLAGVAQEDFALCRNMFADGTPPVVRNQDALQARALCYSGFAILHSGKRHTPVYVAERLNSTLLNEARNNQRTNRFFADARLPRAERAELEDYHGSGFDRGHMAPAGDMAGSDAMAQSFSLANMVPQAPINNRRAWAGIEKATRKYVMRAAGDVYVITGPVYDDAPPTIGNDHVWVPQHLFKLVYDPATRRSWVNWLDNDDQAKTGKPISYQELVRRTGIEFLPMKS